MRGYRFMLCRRWVLFAVAVLLATYACYWLGQWQWHRLETRRAFNSVVHTNLAMPLDSPARVMAAPGSGLPQDHEWRRVTATGTYDAAQTVIVRYREDHEGNAGVDLVVPLVTADGTSLLVDRGFYPTDDTPDSIADVPAAPTGTVTVTGYARVDGTGESTTVNDQSTRAISSARIAEALGVRAYGGFVQTISESPRADTSLEAGDLPELDDGPHFFYALQWWFFGILAVFGFCYLAYDERHNGRRGERERLDREARADRPAEPTRAPEPVRATPTRHAVPVLIGAASGAGEPLASPAPAAPARPTKPVKVRPAKAPKPVKVRQTNVPAAYQRPRKERQAEVARAAAQRTAHPTDPPVEAQPGGDQPVGEASASKN